MNYIIDEYQKKKTNDYLLKDTYKHKNYCIERGNNKFVLHYDYETMAKILLFSLFVFTICDF